MRAVILVQSDLHIQDFTAAGFALFHSLANMYTSHKRRQSQAAMRLMPPKGASFALALSSVKAAA